MSTVIDELIAKVLNGLKGRFQLHIAEGKKGDGAVIASYWIEVGPERMRYEKGTHPNDLAITVSMDEFMLLAQGKLNPVTAFMSGSIKVKGNLQLAMKAFATSEAARKLARSNMSLLSKL